MQHLSGLDATFLHLETAQMPMHVGGLHLLDLAPSKHAGFAAAVRLHVAARRHLASLFSKTLVPMPFAIANPVWVEQDDVDLDYHIRALTLPKPGTPTQLDACVARLHAELLDRARPLWEFYVIKGLQSGQIALYVKLHHAALDGQGAIALAHALLDVSATPRAVEPPTRTSAPQTEPPITALLGATLRDTVSQCVKLVKGVPTALKVASDLLRSREGGDDAGDARNANWLTELSFAPKTLLNVTIGKRRAFAGVTLPLDEAQRIAQAFGATLNDVVLALVSGALRNYLIAHAGLPQQTLVAAVPVSLRAAGDQQQNNQVSMMLVKLASDEADPVARIGAIMQASAGMKKTLSSVKSVMPTEFPSLGLPWLMRAMVALYGRAHLAETLPTIANVVISNVTGPRVPLYLAGARMTADYPVSIVTHGLALNVTVQSYAGALDIGVIACRQTVPDLRKFAACVRDAHAELMACAPFAVAAPAPKRRAPRSAAAGVGKPARRVAPARGRVTA